MPPAQLTEIISDLIEGLKEADKLKHSQLANPIHVSELTSLPAFAYEKIRNIVDYKEENLLRKNAIRRYLKRKFLLPQWGEQSLGQELIRELILSRYLPNDSIDESTVVLLDSVLKKYHLLINEIKRRGCNIDKWREQILGLAAIDCDNILMPPVERTAYSVLANRLLNETLDLTNLTASPEESQVQLILTIERILNRADRDILNYYLLLHYHPSWFNNEDPNQAVAYLAPKFSSILKEFNNILNDRLGKRLNGLVRRLLVPVIIVRNSLKNYTLSQLEIFKNPTKFEDLIRSTYQQFWLATKKRIRRKGLHAMSYIFLTKVVLAILIELPYEKIFIGQINYLPLWINLLFPPLLMLIITLLIKTPDKSNEERLLVGIKELVYGTEPDFYHQQHLQAAKPKLWTKAFYASLYLITIAATFSALVYILWWLDFNVLSGALFIFFISLVSFFGISLRQEARQLKVSRGRENLSSFILDFFSLPIVTFGKWLSNTFDKYNFFVFILDFLFEVPFKTLLKIIEDWFHFLKQKKEEMM